MSTEEMMGRSQFPQKSILAINLPSGAITSFNKRSVIVTLNGMICHCWLLQKTKMSQEQSKIKLTSYPVCFLVASLGGCLQSFIVINDDWISHMQTQCLNTHACMCVYFIPFFNIGFSCKLKKQRYFILVYYCLYTISSIIYPTTWNCLRGN